MTGLAVPVGASTMSTSIIEGAAGAIDTYVPGGKIITGFFKPLLKKLFDSNEPDPSIEAINNLKKEIDKHLNDMQKAIELDIRNGNIDILNQIRDTTYINGFGRDLDELYQQIDTLQQNLTDNNASTRLTPDEKAIENAFLIGNNADWGKPGNIVFNLNRLANVLAGQTFREMDNRDIYQVIYDSNIRNSMFSGEAYDASEPYIDKIMYIYLYGCGVVSSCMTDARIVSRLTEEEINACSPLVKSHYYAAAMADDVHIDTQVNTLATKVFATESETSVMSRFIIFCWKKENCRNIFLDKGHSTPVAISNNIDYRNFDFRSYSCSALNGEEGNNRLYREMKSYMDNSVKGGIQTAFNQSAISPEKTQELKTHVAERYNKSFANYLKDMCGIDLPNNSSWVLPIPGISDKEEHTADTHKGSGIFDIRFEAHSLRTISISGITASGGISNIEMYKYDLDIYGGWITAGRTNNVSLALFQKTTMPDVPRTGTEIIEPNFKLNLTVTSKNGDVYAEDFVVGSVPVDINQIYNVVITDNSNNVVDVAYTWESQKNPREGIKLTPEGMLSFTRRDSYLIRVKCASPVTGKIYYSPWVTVVSYIAGGGEEPEPVDYPIEYTEADENTDFRIYGSFMGTVNAEPECIEGEPSALIYYTEEEQIYSKDHFQVETYDADDLQIYVRYTWEAQEQSGISLAPDGTATFTKSGIYHVRVRSGEYTSEWVEINVLSDIYYTVLYDAYDDTYFDVDFVEPGSTATRPIDPVRNGYTFLYWALEGQEYDFSTPVTENIVLTAVWEPNSVKPNNVSGSYTATGATTTTTTATPTTDTTPDITKYNITGKQNEINASELSWDAIPDSSAYSLYIKVDGKYVFVQDLGKSTNADIVLGLNGKYYVSTGSDYTIYEYNKKTGKLDKTGTLKASKTESIVKANNVTLNFMVKYTKNGKESAEKDSYKVSVKIYYKPAVKITANKGSISLKWDKVPGATKYRVYKLVNGKLKLVTETTKRSVKFNGTKAGKEYTYAVKALVDGKWTKIYTGDLASVKAK